MGIAPTAIKKLRAYAGQAALGKAGQCTTSAINIAFKPNSDPAARIRIDTVVQWFKLWGKCDDDRKEAIRK